MSSGEGIRLQSIRKSLVVRFVKHPKNVSSAVHTNVLWTAAAYWLESAAARAGVATSAGHVKVFRVVHSLREKLLKNIVNKKVDHVSATW